MAIGRATEHLRALVLATANEHRLGTERYPAAEHAVQSLMKRSARPPNNLIAEERRRTDAKREAAALAGEQDFSRCTEVEAARKVHEGSLRRLRQVAEMHMEAVEEMERPAASVGGEGEGEGGVAGAGA